MTVISHVSSVDRQDKTHLGCDTRHDRLLSTIRGCRTTSLRPTPSIIVRRVSLDRRMDKLNVSAKKHMYRKDNN